MKKILISYFGKRTQEADFDTHLSKLDKLHAVSVRKAKALKKPEPVKPSFERATEGTIYFRPNSTMEVSPDELELLTNGFPWIMCFVNVHHIPSRVESVDDKSVEVEVVPDKIEEVIGPVSPNHDKSSDLTYGV